MAIDKEYLERIDRVLDHFKTIISVTTRDDYSGVYYVRLKKLKTEVRVQIYRTPTDDNRYWFQLSHHVHVPQIQAGPYYPSVKVDDRADICLHLALDALVSFYQSGVDAGHTPQESWLVSD